MLLRYIVSNYKSIGHPVEFSMLPTSNFQDERYLKTISTKTGAWKVLHRGGFFGPNASGKSSFIASIDFARDFIVNGKKSGKGTGVSQFKGEIAELGGVSTFQFTFYLKEEVYEYGFTLDRQQIHEEWLMVLTEKDFVPLFTRTTSTSGKTMIDIEAKFARKNSSERKLAEVLKESIQENQKNQLFLYKLYDNGIKKAEGIVGWFKNLQVIFPDTKVKGLPLRMRTDTSLKAFIAESLRRMDTGVFDLSVASDEIDFYDFAEKMNLPKELIEEIEDIKEGIVSLNGKYFIFSEGEKNHTVLVQIKFEHHLYETSVEFNIEEESDGTQRLLDLLPVLFMMGEKDSRIYFIDEIDRSLHTKLSQHLLNEFAKNCEKTNNQIVFTAHDVNLIHLEHFRQDEIWFIEKNQKGESALKPLSDFEVQKNQDMLKAYLNGRFGAIPVIRGNSR